MASGRVCTGFSKPYVALYSNTGTTVTYADGTALKAGDTLSSLKGVASKWLDKHGKEMNNNQSISTKNLIKIKENQVSDGNW